MRFCDWCWSAHKVFLGDTIVTQLCRKVIWYEFVTRDEVIKTLMKVCDSLWSVHKFFWGDTIVTQLCREVIWYEFVTVIKSSKFWWQCVNYNEVLASFLESDVIVTQLCREVIWYEFVIDDEVIQILTRACDSSMKCTWSFFPFMRLWHSSAAKWFDMSSWLIKSHERYDKSVTHLWSAQMISF